MLIVDKDGIQIRLKSVQGPVNVFFCPTPGASDNCVRLNHPDMLSTYNLPDRLGVGTDRASYVSDLPALTAELDLLNNQQLPGRQSEIGLPNLDMRHR